MSGINAINSANLAFGSKKTGEKKPGVLKKALVPVAHVKKDIVNKYGLESEKQIRPAVVADYVAEKATNLAVLVGGGALMLGRARKATNGLTEAVGNAFAKKGTGLIKKFQSIASEVSSNNFKAQEAAIKKGQARLGETVRDAVLKPVPFDNGSKLSHMIDTVTGAVAKGANKIGIKANGEAMAAAVKKGFGKIGIGNGAQVVDTAVAVTAAGVGTLAGTDAVDYATDRNDKEVGGAAKSFAKAHQGAKEVEKGTGRVLKAMEKAAELADMVGIGA